MLLVYYGHFVEALGLSGSPYAFPQWKMIYSMHMPLFFFLAGIFFRVQKPISEILKSKLVTRIVPVLFFSTAAIPFWLMKTGITTQIIGEMAYGYLFGLPSLNLMTWFLVCLFTTEVIVVIFTHLVSVSDRRKTILYVVAFALAGYLVTRYGHIARKTMGVRMNVWYLNEAFIATSFYLLGYMLRDLLLAPRRWRKDVTITVVTGCIFLFTWNLNRGPFMWLRGVVMMCSSHGNILYFFLTSLAGIFFVVHFFRLVPIANSITRFIGRNTLIYMGLNGFCYHFINQPIIQSLALQPQSGLGVFIYCAASSVAMMLILIPLVVTLNRYVPELVGRRWEGTSLLPRIGFFRRRESV
jgi:acyltransferase